MNVNRREFQKLLTAMSTCAFVGRCSTSFSDEVSQDRLLPNITSGVASGDVTTNSAILWSRCDRPARMIVEVASDESFRKARKIVGPEVLEGTDFTGKLKLSALEPTQEHFYRVRFQDLDDLSKLSMPVVGSFKTASDKPSNVKFIWSGDTAGQGYGIDLARGGMRSYDVVRKHSPDFFVNSGDVCYVDNPFPSEMKLDDGSIWKNIVTESTSKVAETLEEFRANYRYNLMDENVRRLNAWVPTFVQWDDHEVLNNWYPSERLTDDDRYSVKSVALLAARARQAFFEYLPIRMSADGLGRIYRSIPYGPLVELFFLDMRSYRAANSPNRQPSPGPDTAFLGNAQIRWLKKALEASQATWKVICSDMPIGIIVGDGKTDFENCANGDGPALGRELEIADLLKHIKDKNIKNTVWLTADIHYCASHYYDPNRAVFQDFHPFWEFVSGPMHAGTFGPGKFDNTFGPQLKFKGIPDGMKANRPPSEGYQFFGLVSIDGQTRTMTVEHRNVADQKLWSIDLPAEA